MPRSVRINRNIDVRIKEGTDHDSKRARIGKSDVLEGNERKAHMARVAVDVPTTRRMPDVPEETDSDDLSCSSSY
jgi:hypothetical protein